MKNPESQWFLQQTKCKALEKMQEYRFHESYIEDEPRDNFKPKQQSVFDDHKYNIMFVQQMNDIQKRSSSVQQRLKQQALKNID